MVGKRFLFTFAQWRRAAGVDAAGTQGIHKVSHVQARFYIVGRVEFSTRAECQAAFFDHFRRQGDVAGDDQVAGVKPFDDFIVGDVEPLDDGQQRNIR